MLAYFREANALHLDVLRGVALGLGLEEEYFTPRCDGNHQNLRLLRYPRCWNAELGGGRKRINEHTDYGSITLLAQDGIGGLQVRSRDGEWISVPPIHRSLVVNVADLLMRWSNDTLRSTEHRVVPPAHGSEADVPERYSIVFFCNPNKETLVHCLPTCSSPNNPPRYAPVNAFDYLTARLQGTIDA
mmetsp:Transcript_110/g.288  ORF Transcript_110/g.288 Transcript_110/m.288 type:complete len:187 (-) Transcript_110:113-673(-)